MRSARSVVVAAVILLASGKPASAQSDSVALWFQFGFGTGAARIACDGCRSGWNLHGPSFAISVVQPLTRRVGIGVGVDTWARDPADSEATNTGTLFVHYYPTVRRRLFVEAGAGPSEAAVGLKGDTVAYGKGWALMAGIGYDLRLFNTGAAYIILVPRVSYFYGSIGNLTYAAGRPPFATGWKHQVLSAGIGLGLIGLKDDPE
ncbi:MAG TPA: hypothetical protein VKB45_05840 [Gemmatimonadales bacterium]|nr:hypothetical protein [Gemmatimonadales bacterium]